MKSDMTAESLRQWVRIYEEQYPVLSELREEKLNETYILKLPVPYGRYMGLIIVFDQTLAAALRRRDEYAVVCVDSYEKALKHFLECAEWITKHRKEGKKA